MQSNSGVEDPANCSSPRGSQRERCFHTPGELDKSIQICTLWLMWSIRSGHRWLFQSVGKTHAHLEWKGSQENCMAVQKVKCSPRNWAWHRLHKIDDKMHHRLHSDRKALGVPLRDMGSWLTKGDRKCVPRADSQADLGLRTWASFRCEQSSGWGQRAMSRGSTMKTEHQQEEEAGIQGILLRHSQEGGFQRWWIHPEV